MSKTIDPRDYGWRGWALLPFAAGCVTFLVAGASGYTGVAITGAIVAIICGFIMPRQMRKDAVSRD